YFNEKPLYLADQMDEELNTLAHHEDTVLIDEFSPPAINSLIHEMRLSKIHAGILLHNDLDALKKAFYKKFMLIKAAGGLVTNENGELLFIFRKNKWDLPKGKLEDGEEIESCAVRETEEETGLLGVTMGETLLTTHHTYDESGHHILKETYWYKLSVKGKQDLKPQVEEHITDIRWVDPGKMEEVLSNTYPLIKDVLASAGF
ncbi:MAG TPA: NUDIX domain-containing protein, partial [Flavitalea sp.]|nr:NUDIX domain-containing protein [Flavitalea sp.]